MENFKKVLKFSIEQKNDYIWLIENHKAIGAVDSSESEIEMFPEISSQELSQVLQALLPSATNLSKGEKQSGFFPVVGVGELQISASKGERLCVGLIINTNDPSLVDFIDQKHKQNTFVAGGLETPHVEDDSSDDISSPSPPVDLPSPPVVDHTVEGTLSIDIPDLEMQQDISANNVDLSAEPANLNIDIPNFGLDGNDVALPVETPTIDQSLQENLDGSGNLSLDMGNLEDPVQNSDLNIDIRSDFSVDPITNVASNDYSDGASIGTDDMFPQSPQLQYTDAYDSPADSHVSKELIFGSKLPGESVGGANATEMDNILRMMIEKGASDLHLTQGEEICLRIDGDIERIPGEVLGPEKMEALILPILPAKNKSELIETNDTDFSYSIEGVARFRVNIFRDLRGIGCVIRQIPSEVLTVEQLSVPESIVNLCKLGKGLVVVTGPTGSGKSTTLAAMVDYINRTRKTHILTIEDPVEFVHKPQKALINQREVYKHTTSFSRALKAALREDPDIVLIGEMRDLETVAIAIETAETGHLVFGTLHTNTAISTIDRLIDQFPSDGQEQIRVMLSDSLKGVVAQTLLKKKGGGRVAAHEVLICDKAVGSQIREKNTHMLVSHMQTQKKAGNLLLNDSLLQLVETGVVDPSEAYSKAVDKDGFASLLKSKKINFSE